MCVSCGCGSVNDNHGDSRNITLAGLDAAAQAAGTTRGRVIQNIAQMSETITSPPAQAGRGDYYGTARESTPASAQPEQGQASDTAWQAGQQTGPGGEEHLLSDV